MSARLRAAEKLADLGFRGPAAVEPVDVIDAILCAVRETTEERTLPTFDEAGERVRGGSASNLDRFIYAREVAGDQTDEWRAQLAAVIFDLPWPEGPDA